MPIHYDLQETESRKYHPRTERNVIDSDGTLILFRESLSGGTQLTSVYARRFAKPLFQADLSQDIDSTEVLDWIVKHHVRVLNVAGPRESSAPGIATVCQRFLVDLLASGQVKMSP